MKTPRIVKFWILLLMAVLLNGCESALFYSQAVKGQFQILAGQKEIKTLIASPETDEKLKTQLDLVLRIRKFAEEELLLPADGNYLRYCDLNREHVVWNVYATEEFSLDDKTWWYPFVGSLSYRGYFSEEQARDYALKFQSKGYDVYVGGVDAYSTLGWFRDPVFNTFVFYDETDLSATIFHELAHLKLFAQGDTDFNEAFATAVEHEGVRRWLQTQGEFEALTKYELELKHENQFVELVESARSVLKLIYEQSKEITDEQLRERKSSIMEQLKENYVLLKREWNGISGYDGWFDRELNNAHLNSIRTYYKFVPAFEHLLQANEGKLDHFYETAKAMKKLSTEDREMEMKQLLTHDFVRNLE